MYCNRCGKEIDYENNLCLECTAELAVKAKMEQKAEEDVHIATPVTNPTPVAQPAPQPQPTSVPNTRGEGRGRAISSVILASCLPVTGGISLGMIISDIIGVGIFFALVAVAMGVVAIINGALSIKTFKEVKNAGYPLPVATLVLGIVGMAVAIISIFVCYVYFILMLSYI